jgi:putative selenium metabolism hydrolase
MHTDRLISFTQALVQRPSLSGQEDQVAARVADEMRALGFDEVRTDAYGSVIGVVNGAQPGKTLLFDAHTDTVGISPGVPWAQDPFSGAVADGAVHGRGAADMKGALAAMVHAAAAADRSKLHGRVVVSASVLEEVLEGVALEKVMERYPPDFVIIGESSNLTLVRGGRGRAEIHLETVGRPSHSSAPQQGRNAVLDMMRVIAVVEQIQLPDHPLMGPAINALTDIISDPYPGHSVIPSICRATYDRRLLPGETVDDVLAPIAGAPEIADIKLNATIGVGEYAAFTGEVFVKEKFFPAWLLPEEDAYVQTALAALAGAGLATTTTAYRFCTNAAYSAGVAGIPTIGYGPATEADAHIINEKLKIDDLVAVANGYGALIGAVLGEA